MAHPQHEQDSGDEDVVILACDGCSNPGLRSSGGGGGVPVDPLQWSLHSGDLSRDGFENLEWNSDEHQVAPLKGAVHENGQATKPSGSQEGSTGGTTIKEYQEHVTSKKRARGEEGYQEGYQHEEDACEPKGMKPCPSDQDSSFSSNHDSAVNHLQHSAMTSTSQRRRKKSRELSKRPLDAYDIFYQQEKQKMLDDVKGSFSEDDIQWRVQKAWRCLTANEIWVYETRAQESKQRYLTEMYEIGLHENLSTRTARKDSPDRGGSGTEGDSKSEHPPPNAPKDPTGLTYHEQWGAKAPSGERLTNQNHTKEYAPAAFNRSMIATNDIRRHGRDNIPYSPPIFRSSWTESSPRTPPHVPSQRHWFDARGPIGPSPSFMASNFHHPPMPFPTSRGGNTLPYSPVDFPYCIPSGMEIALPSRTGRGEQLYKVMYHCYTMNESDVDAFMTRLGEPSQSQPYHRHGRWW